MGLEMEPKNQAKCMDSHTPNLTYLLSLLNIQLPAIETNTKSLHKTIWGQPTNLVQTDYIGPFTLKD